MTYGILLKYFTATAAYGVTHLQVRAQAWQHGRSPGERQNTGMVFVTNFYPKRVSTLCPDSSAIRRTSHGGNIEGPKPNLESIATQS